MNHENYWLLVLFCIFLTSLNLKIFKNSILFGTVLSQLVDGDDLIPALKKNGKRISEKNCPFYFYDEHSSCCICPRLPSSAGNFQIRTAPSVPTLTMLRWFGQMRTLVIGAL